MRRPNPRQQSFFPDEFFPPRTIWYLCVDTEAYRACWNLVRSTQDPSEGGTFRTHGAVSRANALSKWIFAKYGIKGMGRWYYSGRYVMVSIEEWRELLHMEGARRLGDIVRALDRCRVHRPELAPQVNKAVHAWQPELPL